jgi:hypothetical protein
MKRTNATTPVVHYLGRTLASWDIPLFQKVCFEAKGYKRTNLACRFRGKPEGMHLAFSAHHDIVNPKADNVNDNLASVAILMATVEALVHAEDDLVNTVDIIFTDGEEAGATGAKHMAQTWYCRSQPDYLFNLELTARGDSWWVENTHPNSDALAELLYEMSGNITGVTNTPPQDAYAYRHSGVHNAICIGRLPEQELIQWVYDDTIPPTWTLCHKDEDSFDLAVEDHIWQATKDIVTLAEELTPEMITTYKNS